MDNKKNGIPKLRFPGFSGAWEQRKLGEITSHRGGTAIEKYFDENGKYKVISIGSYGLNSKYVDQNIRAKSNEITNERVVHAGELTMVLNDKTANGTIIGRSLLIENDNEYVINQRTEIITPKENFNNKFAYTLLNGPFRNKVRRIVQGGTQIYVNYSSVEKLTLFLPNIKEQEKIGKFFNQLDSLIALHQRKLEHLKEQKKGLLQKMFPKNGEVVPEVRFPGFTDDWEQRKLGETSKITAGGDVDKEKLLPYGKFPVIANALTNDGIVGYYNDDYRITAPAVTVTGRGEIGKAKSRKINFTPVVRLLAVESKHNVDFLAEAINRSRVVFESTGVPQLTVPKLSNYRILFPNSVDEETKIGNFLQQFDTLIALHQRKLEHLKLMKKGLLQQMFV